MRCPRNWECGTWHLDFFSAISTAEAMSAPISERDVVPSLGRSTVTAFAVSVSLDRTFAGFCPCHVLVRRPVHGHRLPSGGRHNLRSGSTPSTLAASTVSGHPHCVEKCQRCHCETGTSVRSMKTTNKSQETSTHKRKTCVQDGQQTQRKHTLQQLTTLVDDMELAGPVTEMQQCTSKTWKQ